MSERWKTIEDLFHRARDLEASERSRFLAEACQGDAALRADVESLLEQASTPGFLDAPALEEAARALAEDVESMSADQPFGGYTILSFIGKGGMGEVYRARDRKLGREVAVKVLPTSLAGDPDRIARFQREAKILGALNHPNIAAIYGLEETDKTTALVMELVEGPTLADRLAQGAIPVDEALAIAAQIAEALETAHDQGIIHRDLKPANVKVKADGTVKVLDFGLAKALTLDSAVDISNSPTLSMAATQQGMILGTAGYMSPEQARGKTVDRRADIWAFGCVLFEMLTGRRAFKGETMHDTLAAVVADEPALDAVPARVRPLVQKCLRKDPRSRWQSIGDVRLAIEEGPAIVVATPTRLPWAIAGVLAAALLAIGIASLVQSPQDAQAVRFGVPIPGGSAPDVDFALSPDGQNLAITTVDDGQRHLWVRSIDTLDARLIPDTEGAGYPFWSPDGTKIGFFSGRRLRTVSSAGGPVFTLVEDVSVRGGSWNRDGTIVFASGREIRRVDEAGGAAVLVRRGEWQLSNPSFLPGGRTFLYTQEARVIGGEDDGVFVGSLDGATAVRLVSDRSKALYASGWLVFRREGRLVAQQFDPDTLALSGAAIPVTSETVTGRIGYGLTVLFSVSDAGALAYQTRVLEQLAWVDRTGTRRELVGPPEQYDHFRLSPDGASVAMSVSRFGAGNSSSEIARVDLGRGVLEVLTQDPEADLAPLWSPDGERIVFTSRRSPGFNPYVTDGPNRARLLAEVSGGGWPVDWSPDGQLVLWQTAGSLGDLWLVPVTGEREPYPYLNSAFSERGGQFSPDGDWIAYSSNESGRDEVYIRALRGDRRFAVSGRGGKEPAWRRDGRELFYVAGDGMLTAVSVMLGEASMAFGQPQSLFPAPLGSFRRNYEVSADGQQFLVAEPATPGGAAITVVLNWTAGLER